MDLMIPTVVLDVHGIAPAQLTLVSYSGNKTWLTGTRLAMIRINPSRTFFRPLSREAASFQGRSEEHTSELQSHLNLVCRLLLEKKKQRVGRTRGTLRPTCTTQ